MHINHKDINIYTVFISLYEYDLLYVCIISVSVYVLYHLKRNYL